MSGLQSITYNELVNQIVSWITSNCINITNYNGINASCKNGYSYNVYTVNAEIVEKGNATITSSLVSVDASTVTANMNNYLSTIGATSYLNTRISDDNFYEFINDMVVFCSYHLKYLASQSNNNANSRVTYLVYDPTQTIPVTYNKQIINSTSTQLVINVSNTTSFVQNLIVVAKQNIRTINCNYTFSIT